MPAMERALSHAPVERLGLAMGVMLLSAGVNVLVSAHLLRVAQSTDSVALAAEAAAAAMSSTSRP